MKRQVLITGGAGFIGSNLVKRLCQYGDTYIHIIDNCKYGSGRIRDIIEKFPDRITLHRSSIQDMPSSTLHEILLETPYIFHLAAEKLHNNKDSEEDLFQTNVRALAKLTKAAMNAKIKKILFTSSLYANGTLTRSKVSEADKEEPTTIYGITKLTGEGLMRHLKGVSNIETVTARLYFIYGPNQDAGTGYPSVITKNFERIDAGQRPLVYGDGSQTLDYLYIDDCIDAILMLMNAQNRHRIYNICSGSYISIRELTDLMIGISKSKLKPMQCDPDWTQGTIRSGSCSRILNEYGWQPKVNLLEGLRMVYNAVSNK